MTTEGQRDGTWLAVKGRKRPEPQTRGLQELEIREDGVSARRPAGPQSRQMHDVSPRSPSRLHPY